MEILEAMGSSFWKIACLLLVVYILKTRRQAKRARGHPVEKGEYAMNIIINKDYKMSKGKVISQICHGMSHVMRHLLKDEALLDEWRRKGEPKVVLKASGNEIQEIVRMAKKHDVYHHRICDAGRTQVPPGANTVLVLGPGLKPKLEAISGHLKLY